MINDLITKELFDPSTYLLPQFLVSSGGFSLMLRPKIDFDPDTKLVTKIAPAVCIWGSEEALENCFPGIDPKTILVRTLPDIMEELRKVNEDLEEQNKIPYAGVFVYPEGTFISV